MAPGRRLGLLAILFLMALIAHTPTFSTAEPGGAGQAPEADSPFDRHGMWIWYVDRSDGGDPARIVARAERHGIGAVYVKAGDAGHVWSQFSRSLVGALHQGGLDVCAWQFVYGDRPVAEAQVGAGAVAKGADCLIIDAEGQYEGKYAAADRYIRALRARIGPDFPLSLAGFPYVDYHPAFPYSVFFGPGGATHNQPQMYWKTIGTSVRAVFEHTYLFNRLWNHPIHPIGQTYERPGPKSLRRFRRFAASYGGAVSWWDWQETSGREWGALGADIAGPLVGYRPIVSNPILTRGSRGDLVVWAQTHLVGAGQRLPITGVFGRLTRAAVRSFQESRGLPVNGKVDDPTWSSLLDVPPVRPSWAAASSRRDQGGATAGRLALSGKPQSASLPAKAYEIDTGPAP